MSGLQYLVGDLRQGAYDDYGSRSQAALHDTNETANGGGVFDRLPSKLHHYDIIVPLKSALPLESAHFVLLLELFFAQKKPPPDRFWRWVRVILLKIALLHPIPSSRRHVIRVDMPVPVDVIRVEFWMRIFIKIFATDRS
jgi:hypothetical protein